MSLAADPFVILDGSSSESTVAAQETDWPETAGQGGENEEPKWMSDFKPKEDDPYSSAAESEENETQYTMAEAEEIAAKKAARTRARKRKAGLDIPPSPVMGAAEVVEEERPTPAAKVAKKTDEKDKKPEETKQYDKDPWDMKDGEMWFGEPDKELRETKRFVAVLRCLADCHTWSYDPRGIMWVRTKKHGWVETMIKKKPEEPQDDDPPELPT